MVVAQEIADLPIRRSLTPSYGRNYPFRYGAIPLEAAASFLVQTGPQLAEPFHLTKQLNGMEYSTVV
jgi:hypothetical protein